MKRLSSRRYLTPQPRPGMNPRAKFKRRLKPAFGSPIYGAPVRSRGIHPPAVALALCLLYPLALLGCAGGSPEEATETIPAAGETPAASLPEDVADLAAIAEEAGEPTEATQSTQTDAAPSEDDRVQLTGELISPVHSELVPRQTGRVGKVLVDLGDPVRRGQLLLTLEPEYFELAVQRAEAEVRHAAADLTNARSDFERKEELLAKGSVAQAVHDRTVASYQAAQAAHAAAGAALALARRQLQDTELRSPLDGVVAERRVDVGESLETRTVAFVVVQVSPLKLRFRLPERYLARVRSGQAVGAVFDAYPGEEFTAKVTTLGRTVDPSTRTLVVEARLPNRDGRLRPGMFAKVTLELGDA